MINTLKAAKRLHQHGFTLDQAEVLADVVSEREENLATKEDIRRLDVKIDGVEKRLEEKINGVKSDVATMKWMVGLFGTLTLGGIIAILLQ